MILAIYRMLAPFAALTLPLAALVSPKIRAGLRLRRARPPTPAFREPPVWIHVSSGEFEYAKPVIREIKALNPDVPVVVTYFSPSYADRVTNFPGVDHAEALPLDLPGPVSAFLDRVRPRACLIARTDFWPELLTQTGRRGLRRVVFAYTQTPVRGVKAWFTRFQLSLVDEVRTVADSDRDLARALAPGRTVETAGDPRFDQVAHRLEHPREIPRWFNVDRPTLVAGSTWPQDETALLAATAEILKQKRLALILVPHEPTKKHLAQLMRRLARMNLTAVRATADSSWGEAHVLVVDEVGYLAELYALGSFAFVGGSFKAKVHSVMEALGAGAVTFTGPLIQNNREAQEFSHLKLDGHPGLTVVAHADEFRTQLEAWLTRDVAPFRRALAAEVERRRGAAARLAAAVVRPAGSINIM